MIQVHVDRTRRLIELARTDLEVGVRPFRGSERIRLRGQRDVAAIGQNDAEFLHGPQHHTRGGRIAGHVEVRAQAQT